MCYAFALNERTHIHQSAPEQKTQKTYENQQSNSINKITCIRKNKVEHSQINATKILFVSIFRSELRSENNSANEIHN